jgi:glycerophosphoryl diester phosphodiesterase
MSPHPAILPDFPRPLLFAHRGLSSRFPENTLAAFKAAKDRGVPGIELDVHLAQGGRLLVFHDDTTRRIPGGLVHQVETADFDVLRSLDIGAWKGPQFSGQTMPLLDEVLEELGKDMYFDIEIKSRTIKDDGLEARLAACLKAHAMKQRCIVSSFNPFSLRRFKTLESGIPTALIWTDRTELHWFLRRGEGRLIAGVDILKPERHLAPRIFAPRILAPLQLRRALPVLPWTVDQADEGASLLELGALGLISNDPEIHIPATSARMQKL